ncbi:MAG: hypothetical protein CM1200mP18_17270 [Gammaproteobacteria bacterium]|nr:MAG: hypothetical protein CM1200mP18_17270 [Gammaproteobacteria bacterium]
MTPRYETTAYPPSFLMASMGAKFSGGWHNELIDLINTWLLLPAMNDNSNNGYGETAIVN